LGVTLFLNIPFVKHEITKLFGETKKFPSPTYPGILKCLLAIPPNLPNLREKNNWNWVN